MPKTDTVNFTDVCQLLLLKGRTVPVAITLYEVTSISVLKWSAVVISEQEKELMIRGNTTSHILYTLPCTHNDTRFT